MIREYTRDSETSSERLCVTCSAADKYIYPANGPDGKCNFNHNMSVPSLYTMINKLIVRVITKESFIDKLHANTNCSDALLMWQ